MSTSSMVEQQYARLKETVDKTGATLATVAQVADEVVAALKAGRKILTAGNGGSASDALHMSEELMGRYRSNRRSLPSVCLAADATAITCIGNDFGFDRIFSRQVEGLAEAGDVLVCFSTSGNSENLVLALQEARKRGVKTLSFVGKDGGKMAGLSDVVWIVPAQDTARIQEMHTWGMHTVLELVESEFPPEH